MIQNRKPTDKNLFSFQYNIKKQLHIYTKEVK